MYNVKFVNNIYENKVFFVFHNEKSDVENNIVEPMKTLLKPLLKTKYFDRSFEENLVCLRYPNPDARETEFACFFDSPFCAAFQHKEFKGVFIIDVSNYTSVVDKPINDLEQYIKENASDDFCFICLFDSSLKKDIEKGVKSKDCDNFNFVDLELDDNVLMEFSKKVEQSTYERLKNTFNHPMLRTKSYGYVNSVLSRVLSNTVSEDTAIAKLTVENSDNKERKIGF